VIRSKDFIFNEDVLYKDKIKEKKETEKSKYFELDDISSNGFGQRDVEQVDEHEVQEEPVTSPIAVRHERRTVTVPNRYSSSLYHLLLTDGGEPSCYDEAMHSERKIEWKKAMDEEMNSLHANQT
jgi:hypothetical protein